MINYSVATIGYKSLINIKKCINEAYNSTHPPKEFVVVVNPYNYSLDQSTAIMEYLPTDPRVTRFAFMSQNIGCAKAFNVGFALCQQDFIVALSDDCRVGPITYEKMINEFKNPDIGIVGVEGGQTNYDGFLCAKGFLLAYRKALIEEAGGYDELASPLADEVEFGVRALYYGWKTAIAPNCEWSHSHDVSANPFQKVNYMGREATPVEIQNEFLREIRKKTQYWSDNKNEYIRPKI